MPPHAGSACLGNLPVDLIKMIVEEIDDAPTLKRLRLCCTWLSREADRGLFAHVTFGAHLNGLKRVTSIAKSSRLAGVVRILHLRQTQRLARLDYGTWCRFGPMTWGEHGLTHGVEVDDDGYTEAQKNYYRHRGELFEQYNAQRLEPTLYKVIHARRPTVAAQIYNGHPCDTLDGPTEGQLASYNMEGYQRACQSFEAALRMFTHLKEFRASFSRSTTTGWFVWRHLWFGVPPELPHGPGTPLTIREEATPLAFVLRALGKGNGLCRNALTEFTLKLDGDEWWGLGDLDHAWVPDRNSVEYSLAKAVPSLALIQNTYAHLTDFNVTIGHKTLWSRELRALARILNTMKALVRLRISLLYEGSNRGVLKKRSRIDMLAPINECAQWPPNLAKLELSNFQCESSTMLRTLTHLRRSLRDFSLYKCRFSGWKSMWTDFYKKMRLIRFEHLRHIAFRGCEQDIPFTEGEFVGPMRQLYITDHTVHGQVVLHYRLGWCIGYSSEIYDFILGKTDDFPPLLAF